MEVPTCELVAVPEISYVNDQRSTSPAHHTPAQTNEQNQVKEQRPVKFSEVIENGWLRTRVEEDALVREAHGRQRLHAAQGQQQQEQ